MFYCDDCGKRRDWPTDSLRRSYGPCEICKKGAACNDVPSSHLPAPKYRACPKCEGAGFIDAGPDSSTYDCEACDGSGRIPREAH